jgi:nucleolar protein 15
VGKETKKKSVIATKEDNKSSSSKNPKTTKSPPPKREKDKKQKEQQQEDQGEENLVLYIGHLPKEFEERDLISFLSQFGKVLNCRISRKVETGNSRGYAFVRFGNADVCRIVCDTLHGYFLGRQRLVCQVRPAQRGMFYNTDTIIQRRIQQKQMEKKQRDRKLANLEILKKISARLISREEKKRNQLKSMGIEYDFPGFKNNQEVFPGQLGSKNIVMDEHKEDKVSRKRPDPTGSDGSDKDAKKKMKESTSSVVSASKRSKRAKNDSVDIEKSSKTSKRTKSTEPSEPSQMKQSEKKRKDSIDSQGSAKKKKTNAVVSILSSEGQPDSVALSERVTQSARKAKKKKNDKKRRVPTP